MEAESLNLGNALDISINQAVWIIDSTKLNSFQTCPRKYFYEHLLGWRFDKPNIHLKFGEAFHEAIEHLIIHRNAEKQEYVLSAAFDKFMNIYRNAYPPEDDIANAPKDPANCLKALAEYQLVYRNDDFELLYSETAGAVHIDEDHVIHFKIDTIVRGDEGIYALEHKTASRQSSTWNDQWTMALQVGTYSHALYCCFPENEVYGVKINGVFLRKSGNGFVRVPIKKDPDSMRIWMSQVRSIVDTMEREFQILSEESPADSIMSSFPIRTTSCINYGSACPFLPYCSTWANPLERCMKAPLGFKVDHWDPRRNEEKAKHTFDSEKLRID